MRIGESGGSRSRSPDTQSRATAPSSFVRRHSRLSLTSGRDRKNAVNIVSTWRFQPSTGKALYGRWSRELRSGRNSSRAPPPISTAWVGLELGMDFVVMVVVATWIEAIGRNLSRAGEGANIVLRYKSGGVSGCCLF